jgi:hypothetical protein
MREYLKSLKGVYAFEGVLNFVIGSFKRLSGNI